MGRKKRLAVGWLGKVTSSKGQQTADNIRTDMITARFQLEAIGEIAQAPELNHQRGRKEAGSHD